MDIRVIHRPYKILNLKISLLYFVKLYFHFFNPPDINCPPSHQNIGSQQEAYVSCLSLNRHFLAQNFNYYYNSLIYIAIKKKGPRFTEFWVPPARPYHMYNVSHPCHSVGKLMQQDEMSTILTISTPNNLKRLTFFYLILTLSCCLNSFWMIT